MGELSYDVIDQATPYQGGAYVLPEGSRPAQLRHGHAVPLSERNVAEIDVERGGYTHALVLACAHCPAVLVYRWLPVRDLPKRAREGGWTNSKSSWGWLCGECTALFGVAE